MGGPIVLPPNVQMLPPLRTELAVRLRHRAGALDIDVDFKLYERWTVLFGPSGSGKTTILKAIAGLLRPDEAQIACTVMTGSKSERTFVFVDTETGCFLPAHKRVVRLAPQQAALFPHLSILENTMYGFREMVRDEQEKKARDNYLKKLLSDFQIAHLVDEYPAALSGGEAQRVNLARAAAASGSRLLMLDEPFSGLDVKLRDELITSLRERQERRRMPVLSVTHDVAEVFQLGAEVIKIADGKVVEQGPVEVVLAEERRRLLAQLGNPTSQTRDAHPSEQAPRGPRDVGHPI
jgi:molybdate transport system ATP-binding protein